MSVRGTELMTKAGRQLEEISEFVESLHDEDLRRPCQDESGHGSGDVGAAIMHVVEGYQRLGQFLRSTGYVPGSPDTGRIHGDGHGHAQRPETVAELRDRLMGGRVQLDLMRQLTDDQLDSVPARVNQFADGNRTLGQVIETVLAHQAADVVTLRRAVAQPLRGRTNKPRPTAG